MKEIATKALVREVAAPMLARVGSLTSGFLIGAGAPATEAEQVAVGAVALVLIVADLAVGHFFRRKGVTK